MAYALHWPGHGPQRIADQLGQQRYGLARVVRGRPRLALAAAFVLEWVLPGYRRAGHRVRVVRTDQGGLRRRLRRGLPEGGDRAPGDQPRRQGMQKWQHPVQPGQPRR